MSNQEVFKQYGSERWVIEQNLYFLMQEYWEELYKNGYIKESKMPINPIGFIKKFMKRETACDIEYAEKSKINTLESKEVLVID